MTIRVQRPRRADSIGDVDHAEPVRFGVLGGTSMVARLAVIPAVVASAQARLAVVASRTPDAVEAVDGARITDDYEAVLADDTVEAVYIPLPNGLHRRWVEAAAEAGKHVLCEKPLALTADDAKAMAATCEAAGVVLMEAYMSPFHTRNVAVVDLVASGRLGPLRSGHATFTFPHANPSDHRWDPELGGGALADVGIYVLSPLFEVAGADLERFTTRSVRTERGVDATTTGFLEFANGFTGSFVASMELPERQHLELAGTEARLRIDEPFTAGVDDTVVELIDLDGTTERIEVPGNDSYRSMVDHFCAVVRGRIELRRPVAESVAFAAVLERLASGPKT